MGSGHFLTSAIDHIEQKMAAFLAEDGQSIPGVVAELLKLESAAKEALGEIGKQEISKVATWGQLPQGATVTKTPVLFPRLEVKE
jgi:hypothetical protein